MGGREKAREGWGGRERQKVRERGESRDKGIDAWLYRIDT